MEATKNRGRRKVFACFKPPIIDGDNELAADDTSPDETRKTRLRRSFSAALKAVLFKTSLKKCRSENSKHESYKFRNSFFFSKSSKKVVKKNSSSVGGEHDHELRTNSDGSPLFSSNSSSSCSRGPPSLSSSASSSSSHSRSGSEEKIRRSKSMDFKQMNKQKSMRKLDCGGKSSYNLNIEIFVVWVCLLALVWGKVFAIVICTSSWLFFAPAQRRLRHSHHHRLRRYESFDVVDPAYNKRVIMEGLLDRNR